MKDGRHIIWSNDIDYDDWREDLEEQYPDLTEAERRRQEQDHSKGQDKDKGQLSQPAACAAI